MRASKRWIAFGLSLALCGADCSTETKAPKPTPAPNPPPPPPPPPAPPKPVSSEALAPRHQVKGEGITITEFVDGRVNVKTTMAWGEAFNTTYDSCVYYRGATPVLHRQLIPERAKLLDGICVASPAEAKAEAKARAKAALATKAALAKAVTKKKK